MITVLQDSRFVKQNFSKSVESLPPIKGQSRPSSSRIEAYEPSYYGSKEDGDSSDELKSEKKPGQIKYSR